jgi:hypothetical protein
LAVESNESFVSSAEGDLILTIVPPIVHTSSYGIKAQNFKNIHVKILIKQYK